MVTPRWLKAGFMSATNNMNGKMQDRKNFPVFFPPNQSAYPKEQQKEIAKNAGCIRNILQKMTLQK